MRSSALRSIAKINSNVLQNSSRLFSYKFEMTPASCFSSETTEEVKPPPAEEAKPSSFRYTVCQTRSSPLERPSATGDVNFAQKQTVRAAIEQQNLQPSMLPDYYQASLDRSVLLNPEPEPSENLRINQGHMSSPRKFQVSKTCANATLPLKSVKLANPFPEPVKMMMSRTVADDEKAELMLAESKSQSNTPDWAKPSTNFRSFSTDIKRWYSNVSTDPDKCKKAKVAKKETNDCPKMKVKGCAPPARKSCDRLPVDPKCKKQEAPYPAYSELCHEDADIDCQACRWQPARNTTIKAQKKKFHTATWPQLKRSGLEIEDTQMEQAPQPEPNISVTTAAVEAAEEQLDGMLCDMRKPDCKPPTNRKCPPGTTKSEREKKNTPDKPKSREKTKKAASQALEGLVERELLPIRNQTTFSLKTKGEKEQGEQGGCKIKKFKFPPCKEGKKDDSTVIIEKCPKKKKKKIIKDCPKTDDQKCEAPENVVEYRLMANKNDGSKCPEIDTSTDPNAIDKNRCNKVNPGTTKECPGDLLQKKKRKGPKNKKKASSIIPPVEPEPEKPQRPQPTLRRV